MNPNGDTERWIARALTFEERRRLQRRGALVGGSLPEEAGSQRLRRWEYWLTHDGAEPDGWQRFLAAHGTTAGELLTTVDARLVRPAPLRWARTLEKLAEFLARDRLRPRGLPGPAGSFVMPVVRYAWSELHTLHGPRLRTLLAPRASADLRATLRARLALSARQAAGGFRPAGGDDATLGTGTRTPGLARLLGEHPALARLWSVQIDHWLRFVGDFLRGVKDLVARRRGTIPWQRPVVRRVEGDLSDPHDGGRTVLGVRLADGSRWFYKPRSGAHEQRWFDLLRWLDDEGFPAPFQTVEILTGKNACWMAGVQPRSCRTRAEVARAFFRAGALLHLVHRLDGVDIHAGNLVVSGPQPVIVDPETLFHPAPPRRVTSQPPPVRILRTGMLPVPANLPPGVDSVSALGRRAPGPHSVRWRGRVVPVAGQVPAIVEGFRALHDFLGQSPDRAGRFDDLVRELRRLRWRRVPRPTAHYGAILEGSRSAVLLSDGLDRSLYLYAACGLGRTPPTRRRAEAACLEQGDIPRFYRRGGGARRQPGEIAGTIATVRAALSAA